MIRNAATLVLSSLLIAALTTGCETKPKKTESPGTPAKSVGSVAATDDSVADKVAAPADEAPAGDTDSVRPPTADDLAAAVEGIPGEGDLLARFETSQGNITCKLHEKLVPMTVANFVGLARGKKPFINPKNKNVEQRPYYDGTIFHRVIPGFMIQFGDPLGMGSGGPGYRFADEFSKELRHDRPGILSMANSGPGTNGSQMFITEAPTPHLNDKHSVLGTCGNLDIIKKITGVEKAPGSKSRPAEDIILERVVIERGTLPQ